jgi:chemotaxis protein methyltransferase CheR
MVHAISGIRLADSKRDLVVGRLNRRLRALGLTRYADYRALLEDPDSEAERAEMINAITTNLTSFFREPHHFHYLADTVLPALLTRSRERRLRIWSAACSSGEEPYSIAMVLHRALQNKGNWDARILATDIDSNMVETARQGCYDAERAVAVPSAFRRLVKDRADGTVVMSDEIKRYIVFKTLNLLESWPMRGRFDAVFCRNVVIYFDKDLQRVLFDRIADLLQPDGILFIGHSESLFRVTDRFENLGRTIYRKLA